MILAVECLRPSGARREECARLPELGVDAQGLLERSMVAML